MPSQSPNRAQSPQPTSILPSNIACDRRTSFWERNTRAVRVCLAKWSFRMYIVRGVFHSALVRIRLLCAKEGTHVDLGPAPMVLNDGSRTNTRTRSRAEGIQMLLAKYYWADSLDLRIFLDGFDAGEEFGKAHPTNTEDKPQIHGNKEKEVRS